MSEALLVPIRLSALVVPRAGSLAESVQPAPTGGPTAPGVYLRWNLPAGLTRGEPVPAGQPGAGGLRFPAVPDRWLVLRFSPGATAEPTVAAWLVDSRLGSATRLPGAATVDAPVTDGRVVTVAGVWADGVRPANQTRAPDPDNLFEGLGYPSWQKGARPFGLYDDQADLPLGSAYAVSYLVLGWYGDLSQDPLGREGWSLARVAAMNRLRWSLSGLAAAQEILGSGAPAPEWNADGSISLTIAGAVSAVVAWEVPTRTLLHGALHGVPSGASVTSATPRSLQPTCFLDESMAAAIADWTAWTHPDPMRSYIEALVLGRSDPDRWEEQEWQYQRHATSFESTAETVMVEGKPQTLPSWYRPGLPYLLIAEAGRSAELEDAGGKLRCRAGREVLAAWDLRGSTSSAVAFGFTLWLGARQRLALPSWMAGVVDEAVLLDPNTPPSSWSAELKQCFAAATLHARTAGVLRRDALPAEQRAALPAGLDWSELPKGTPVAPADPALVLWSQPWVPVAVRFEATLDLGALDAADPMKGLVPDSWGSPESRPAPLSGTIVPFKLHAPLTPMGPRLLSSGLERSNGSSDADSEKLAGADLLSCAVDGIDALCRERGLPLRAGCLTSTLVEVQDLWGRKLTLNTGTPLNLSPRLPYAARLSVRYRKADGSADATVTDSPVLGYLMADPVDRAVEILRPDGTPWGQVRDGATPTWDRVDGEAPNAVLEQLRVGLLGAHPAATGAARPWNVGDLLDVIDTTRLFVDPATGRETGWRNRLAGRPVAVLRAQIKLERAPADKGGRPDHVPPLTSLPVELGNLTLGNDGLLAWFVVGRWSELNAVDPSLQGQIRASTVAKDPTIALTPWTSVAVRHQRLRLEENVPADLILLVDGTADFAALSRLLPLKRISAQREWFDAARDMVPSILVGPVLESPTRIGVPAPPIDDRQWRLASREGAGWLERDVRGPMLNDLPEGRIKVLSGWLRAR